jgi:hypothetical protein
MRRCHALAKPTGDAGMREWCAAGSSCGFWHPITLSEIKGLATAQAGDRGPEVRFESIILFSCGHHVSDVAALEQLDVYPTVSSDYRTAIASDWPSFWLAQRWAALVATRCLLPHLDSFQFPF